MKEMTGKMLGRLPKTIVLIAGHAGRKVIDKVRRVERQKRRPKNFEPVELIPLDHAVLCEDCQMISWARNNHCLSCGSHSILSLASVLGSQPTTSLQHKPTSSAEPETLIRDIPAPQPA